MIVVGADTSLTCTGVAIVDAVESETLAVRSIRSAPIDSDAAPYEARADRILGIAHAFGDLLERYATDVPAGRLWLVVESRDFQTAREKGGSAFDRAWLTGQFILSARAYGALVAAVTPSTLKVYATGNGRADKRAIVTEVARRYRVGLANDNEADAVTLAAMGADAAGFPLAFVPPSHNRALESVRWPNIPATTNQRTS